MSRKGKASVPAIYRWSVASRVLAATVGCYVLAALLSSALALALPRLSPASRADGVLIATVLSFVVYTVAALWVFCARTALRAWSWLAIIGAVAAAVVLLLQRTA
ncbi:MAG: iron transporter [Comamonadaceae bacterium]|nr:MAG: iron transporter [Comamonadaceae bacterium]